MERVIVFIPMYNCQKQIVRVLKQFDKEVLKYIDEILIVDNRSTDNSEQVVMEYIDKLKDIKVTMLKNNENYNLGGSHKVAFQYAIKNHYDYLIVLHGDDQGDIHDILPYLANGEYKQYDSLLGSRFMKESILGGYSQFRTFGNRIYNIIFSIIMGKRIFDLGAGLNMYKIDSLKNNYYVKYPDKLTFNCYMLLATKCYHQKIKFIPISWREDDQVSNVKMLNQALVTLKLAIRYFFQRQKYLEMEHRAKIIDNYSAEVICKM